MEHPPHANHEDEHLKRCDGCGAIGYDEDIYCARCGTLFGPVCERCRTPIIHPIAFYCVRCGEKFGQG